MKMMKDAFLSFVTKLFQWRRTNPKKTIFFAIVAMTYLYHRTKKYIRGKRSLASKVVLITGAVSGIGRSTALTLKRMNAVVIVWDINQEGLKEMEGFVDMTGSSSFIHHQHFHRSFLITKIMWISPTNQK